MTKSTDITPATKRPRKMAREPRLESVGEGAAGPDATSATGASDAAATPSAPKAQTKAAIVLDLLRRPEGASIEQLVAATGWLPHTTRAALTGLRKKGHTVTSDKPEGAARVYRLAASEAVG